MTETQFALNVLGERIGTPLLHWAPPALPSGRPMEGRYCRLESLDAERHARQLFEANAEDVEGRMWTYLPYGPFACYEEYLTWVTWASSSPDPLFFAIVDTASGIATGVASYLRMSPKDGSIEVGHIGFAPRLQRTAAATEAMYLMMKRAFALGYRRYEWKCDALNQRSRAAAQRLGLSFEGVFRQATLYKGRNRDTAWFAAIDQEWPELERALQAWLDPSNFDASGQQRQRLSVLTSPILKSRG